ncbi:hypothetical protein S7711_07420 [Stachybotrys chartarum IBT 7711]|uniref:Chromatin modification-related protein EAF3 n=1 Tax=Stachybotrys chartarum (strain CBS 109288 / IBT 7711) TaxID=1280523 RepID=A0A084AFH9_STACB|nr:hypothetical protein S7711_07420 [Stachybotrys chartarum IBT 7711]
MAPARQQPTQQFNKDEKVLCFHMDMLYEAKIMDVQPGEKAGDGFRYKVHYKGWKNTWDDWVLADRIRPFDQEHKELAAQLHAQLKSSLQKNTKQPKRGLKNGGESSRGSEERSSAAIQGARGGRRGKDWELEQVRRNVSLPLFICLLTFLAALLRLALYSLLFATHFILSVVEHLTFGKRYCAVAFPASYIYPALSRAPEMKHIKRQQKPKASKSCAKPNNCKLKESLGPSKSANVTDGAKLMNHVEVKECVTLDEGFQLQNHQHTNSCPRINDVLTNIQEDTFHNKPMIHLPVPDHIQAMLVDDWENITKNNQLVPLPHNKPVTKIFEDYLAYERPHRDEGSSSMDILEEVIAGLREYFEKSLGRILLYRFERHQYMDLRKLWDNNTEQDSNIKSVCDVYGAEHLARLIVSLPELLAQTNMDQQSVSRLREEIGKFTVWLGRNCEKYFSSAYDNPSQEYIDKARSF